MIFWTTIYSKWLLGILRSGKLANLFGTLQFFFNSSNRIRSSNRPMGGNAFGIASMIISRKRSSMSSCNRRLKQSLPLRSSQGPKKIPKIVQPQMNRNDLKIENHEKQFQELSLELTLLGTAWWPPWVWQVCLKGETWSSYNEPSTNIFRAFPLIVFRVFSETW